MQHARNAVKAATISVAARPTCVGAFGDRLAVRVDQ
jgi:hypothetical protein